MPIHLINIDRPNGYISDETVLNVITSMESDVNWWHWMSGCWIVKTDFNANEIFERLKPVLSKTDWVLVIEINNDYQGYLPEHAWKWLRSAFTKEALENNGT